MSKQTEAQRLAQTLSGIANALQYHHSQQWGGETVWPINGAVSELLRQETLIAELAEALQQIMSDCQESPFKAIGLHSHAMDRARIVLANVQTPNGARKAEVADAESRGIHKAAAYLDKQAEEYADRLGGVDPETGALEFKHEPYEEHYNTLRELADEVRSLAKVKQ